MRYLCLCRAHLGQRHRCFRLALRRLGHPLRFSGQLLLGLTSEYGRLDRERQERHREVDGVEKVGLFGEMLDERGGDERCHGPSETEERVEKGHLGVRVGQACSESVDLCVLIVK